MPPRPPDHVLRLRYRLTGEPDVDITRAEARRLLRGSTVRALFDGQPAAELQRSAHGLKKPWRGICERILDAVPDFFGDTASADELRPRAAA